MSDEALRAALEEAELLALQLNQLRDELESQHHRHDELALILAERTADLTQRDQALAERDRALAERDANLAQRDSALAQREATIADQEQLLQALKAERDQLASQANSQSAQDTQLQEEAELLRLQLNQVQEELESQHQSQDDLRRTLAERDQALALQARSLADLEAARDALLSERDQWAAKATSGGEAQKVLQAEHAKQLAQRDATLAERDKALAELSISLKTLKDERDQWAQRARSSETDLKGLRTELETLKSRQDANLAERDRKIADLNNRFKALKDEQERARNRARETESLLATAQKMLEGQAAYLEDLSRKEEQAELALERERQYEAELLHFLAHSRASANLKPELIPRIRALLQRQANPERNHQPT